MIASAQPSPARPALPQVPRYNLIGPGRVGRTLSELWLAAGVMQLQAVFGRRPAAAEPWVQHLGQGQLMTDLADLPPADIWLLAVPDAQLASTASLLAQSSGTPQRPAIAWHASGFLPAAELAPLQALGWSVASVHPALSFADVATARRQFPGTVCALEGDAAARAAAQACFSAIGGRCFELMAADKPLYHGAAVFASNFLPVLQAVATELWQGTGVPAEWIGPLAHGFVQRAADNLAALGPQAALTGPAARGDQHVLTLQGAAMAQHDATLGRAYQALSELAGRLARQGRCLDEAPPAPASMAATAAGPRDTLSAPTRPASPQ